MGQQCSICAHPARLQADALLGQHVSLAVTARRLGLPYQPLVRHVRNGHVQPVGAGVGTQPSAPAPTLGPDASAVEVLREAMDALRQMDPKGLSAVAQVARIDAIRRAAEAVTKYEPPEKPTSVGIDDIAGMDRFIAVLFEELEPYGDLRELVAERLKKEVKA